ncbi:uncharacterized protein FOMMEDRAFT_28692 [Fomitiporia mediterranea MF3/22]|uniref:uncharacterized protein n=1 Tax=Fomitiporia mediterranea (strain MF3/22) TaxID=694068 RepID=UPI0004409145|nr:uncharacterized protein FOMMEDRAFT_28692 [Fomitiporia mediterranea MF3/22]EJD03109.1 hypothetical protein FOMMEDRAFT_28692 [Fomitiporia mediterranea MF3/22]
MDSAVHSRAGTYAFSAIESIATLQYYCLAAIVILYYDFALTFRQEIQRIWKQKISIVSCIFVLNRYLTCLGYIPIVYFLFNSPDSDKACTAFARFPGALSTITQVFKSLILDIQLFIVVILIMRVYALYQAKRWILWLTVPLGALSVAIAAEYESRKLAFKLSWFINGAFDILIFLLTVVKTCYISKEHRQAGMRSGLTRLLIRDGGMFFG